MDMEIDMNKFMQQLEDMVVVKAMTSVCPDEKTKKFIRGTLEVFLNNGVSAITTMKILTELSQKFNEGV